MEKEQIQKKIDSFGIMKSEWMKKQVEGHLFFGLIYRYIPFLFLGGAIAILSCLWSAFNREGGLNAVEIGDLVGGMFIGGVMIYLSFCFSKYQQAVIAWFSVKLAMGIAAFIMMTVGTLSSLSKQQSDVLPNFLLGLLWLPGIEFIPKVVPYQKAVTVARLILTIPLGFLGVQSGHWTWN